MKKNLWKIAGSFAAILSAGTITAGCQTSETVTVAAGPSGSAVIVEECATESCAQAQQAKNAMQPTTAAKASQAACKTACTDKDGKEIPFNVAVNDKVLIAKYGGTEVTVNGTTYVILNESDILAIID